MWGNPLNYETKFFFLNFNFFILWKCPCATYISGVHRSRKMVLDPLEWELQGAVSHHVGSGN